MSIIKHLWQSQPGDYFFFCTRYPWRDHVFKRSELDRVDSFIKKNIDKDIYFCPHGFSKPQRKKEYAMKGQLLYADLDDADPRKIEMRPTIALESSPGRYVGLWIVDGEVDEDLNRRLTYKVGGDPSGWDLTQVLRVPSTINYKPEYDKPLVRLLWSNGPTYDVKKLRRYAPPLKDEDDAEADDEVAGIFKKYQKKLPIWCRRELLGGKPRPGARSDMIWKLNHTLLEAGMTTEEAFVLLRASPWNKFKGRDAQLRRELDKAVKEHLGGGGKIDERGDEEYRWGSVTMEQVELKSLDWLWYPYLAKGELTILEGDPGVGKSYLAQMISAALCDGKKLPSVRPRHIKGRVLYFDVENSGGTVTKARLLDNDMKELASFIKEDRPFSVDDDDVVAEVMNAIERIRPVLVVFDTINAYIGKADTNNASQTTQAFSFFRDIVQRFHCAGLVLRHLTKGGREKAIYRGQGSIAFAGLARIIITVGLDPEDKETKIMAMTKNNFTKLAPSMSFYIEELPPTLKRDDRSRFVWGELREDITADDLVSADNGGGKGGDNPLTLAKELLSEALTDGPADLSNLLRMGEARGVSKRVLYRAAQALGVETSQKGFGREKTSIWTLKIQTKH